MWVFIALGILQFVLLVLKITKVLLLSWWLIWIPLYIAIGLVIYVWMYFRVI